MAVSLSGKIRTVLDLPMGITLQDVAPDGTVLVSLNSKRLAMGFSTLGSKQDVELSWHDWNVAKGISPDGKFVLFEDASEAAGPGYAVALRKVDGTLPVRLGEGSAGGLSPDGKWAISVSTTQPQRVTLLPIGAGQPRSVEVRGLEHIQSGWARFLEDGQRLIANANEQGHSTRCYVLDLVGGTPKPVTPEGTVCGPSSPDSRYVVDAAGQVNTLDPVAAIEVDDRSHLLPERRDRDAFVNAVFAEIGVPLLRVKAQRSYSVAELRALFAHADLSPPPQSQGASL